jgi:NAD(P)-dependent dehydrogenase (short-subunit alcohol dehydrogenase family)
MKGLNTMLLENKTAVIFGAGAIGGAVARTFAQEGATVFIASRTLASADKVAAEVIGGGGTAEAASVDASDEDAVEEYVGEVAARSGQIDILFNAISMDDVQGTSLLDIAVEDFARPVLKVTRTQFVTARAVARRMVKRGAGVILSVTVAPTPVPYHGGFGVACATIEGLWRSFAAELGPHGVRLVILRSAGSPDAPDVQETFVRHAAAAGISPEEFLAQASSVTLLRRLPRLDEVASAAALMASDRASAMTAAMANVTSGFWVDV